MLHTGAAGLTVFSTIPYVHSSASIMNALVILAVAVACMAQTAVGGYAGAHYAGAHYAGAYYPGAHGYAGHYGAAYHGPLAVPVVLPSGYLADTPEVAHAKGAHLNALAKAGHAAGYAGGYGHGAYGHGAYGYGGYGHGAYGHGAYHGHQAVPVVLPSGYLADTPEVAHAKAAHLNALSHSGAVAHYSGYGHGHDHYAYHH